jgi:hypothetical protein
MATGLGSLSSPGPAVPEDWYPALAEWTTEEDRSFAGVLLDHAGAGGGVGLVESAGDLTPAALPSGPTRKGSPQKTHNRHDPGEWLS